jgi:2-methylisocitrate lyase-like PEP mutase family enzyme
LLADKDTIIVIAGVYDRLSARIALEVGFDCIYIVSSPYLSGRSNIDAFQTGAGTCASKLGQPDLGFASLNDMRDMPR